MANVQVNVANGIQEIQIKQGDIYSPDGARYSLKTIDSVIALVKRKGSLENTVIAFNNSEVSVVLDDSVMDRPKDTASMSFVSSDELGVWKRFIGSASNQKSFVDFLKKQTPEQVPIIEDLMARVQRLKVATSIVGDYEFDDNNNFSVMFKTADGESQTKMPSRFLINIPLIFGDPTVYTLEVELQLNKPKQENEKPTFTLTIPNFDKAWREAVENQVAKLKKELDGYLILNGAL